MPRRRKIGEYCSDAFLDSLIGECDKTPYKKHPDYSRKRDKALIATLFLTGGLLDEVLMLKKENFDFENEDAKRMNAFLVRNMRVTRYRHKKGEPRFVSRTFPIFYDEPLVQYLLEWLREADDYLFPGSKGGHLKKVLAWKRISDLGKRLNFPIKPKWFRDQRMYYLAEKGFESIDIQKYLKMKNLPTIGTRRDSWHTLLYVTRKPRQEEILSTGLMRSAGFLRLDSNWFLATCALQLQEVAIKVIAERKEIKLNKRNVEKILKRKVEIPSFNHQYKAFSKVLKTRFGVEMPILPTHLRKMRVKVLHEAYNPKPEETDSIKVFTIGLLQKLSNVSQTTSVRMKTRGKKGRSQ